MKTFLVPVDFSAVSGEIVDTAVGFARAFSGKVVLLHVIQPPIITSEYALPVDAVQEAMTTSEKNALAKLAAFEETIKANGVDVSISVRHGPPVFEILEAARKHAVDYIIMGSHGHGRIYDLLVGSTASGVIKESRCGVVIMPDMGKHA
ncbi:MAG TPA: universal stress protein [Lacunisphaera sp.]|nr:universal stress protein [Lacunisphaera sp.]